MFDSNLIISCFAMFCVFIPVPMAIVWIFIVKFKKDQKEYSAKMDAVVKSVEMGRDLPEGFLVSEQPKKRLNLLEMGIIFVAIALALFIIIITLFDMGIVDAFGVSVLPLFVGLAQILIHIINVRNQKNRE